MFHNDNNLSVGKGRPLLVYYFEKIYRDKFDPISPWFDSTCLLLEEYSYYVLVFLVLSPEQPLK